MAASTDIQQRESSAVHLYTALENITRLARGRHSRKKRRDVEVFNDLADEAGALKWIMALQIFVCADVVIFHRC